MLTALQKQLLNDFQQDFPLSPTPYRDMALALCTSEEQVLKLLADLRAQRYISRIGPVIAPNQIGVSSLVAMAVPPAELQIVADLVSRYEEVNHNYEREHYYNLWFVLMAADDTHLQRVLREIEQKSGYPTMQLPLLADYFINLGFQLEYD